MGKRYDAVIIGGGPAGCACALELKDSDLSVGLFEKESFPREKVCGDALGQDVIRQLQRMDTGLYQRFMALEHKQEICGFEIVAPNRKNLRKSMTGYFRGNHAGYVMRRSLFDNWLLKEVKDNTPTVVHMPLKFIDLSFGPDYVELLTSEGTFRASMVVGADGMGSLVGRKAGISRRDHRHDWMAARVYFRNVVFAPGEPFIEFHFLQGVLPGYFWIFPAGGGLANVGTGIPVKKLKKKGVNIISLAEEIVRTDSHIRARLGQSEPAGRMQAYPIPMYHRKCRVSGDRCLLVGDAASLVNPLTGEGIGNAIRSGRIAARHIQSCFAAHRFGHGYNRRYDRLIYRSMGRGLRLSLLLSRLINSPGLLNLIVSQAGRSPVLKAILLRLFEKI